MLETILDANQKFIEALSTNDVCPSGLLEAHDLKFVHQEPEQKPKPTPAPVLTEVNPLHAGDEQEQTAESEREDLDTKADHGVGIAMCDLKAVKSHSGGTNASHFDKSNAEKKHELDELKQDLHDTIG